ncbi:hypothetical protein VTN96DRAFT_5179 [Rasamsonia emersonii]
MLLGLPESLPALVGKRFTAARESGSLVFSPTQLTTIHAGGIAYQLRYCPALAKKPKPSNEETETERRGPKPDPFQDPSPDLLVAEIPTPPRAQQQQQQQQQQPSHILVLNKFPVIPNHFILATKTYKEQTDLLEKEDLAATWACLREWETPQEPQKQDGQSGQKKRRLFAFFNSGPDSGASQPHRHLQFLPVEDMRAQEQEQTSDSGGSWEPLIDKLSTERAITTNNTLGLKQLPELPFAHFACDIPPDASAERLHEIYLKLYRAAVTATQSDRVDDSVETYGYGPAAISYNLAMTVSTMMICPRRREHARLDDIGSSQDGSQDGAAAAAAAAADAGLVSLNGTILAGTLMVKAENEWDELRRRPDSLNGILASVGFPWSSASTRL